MITLSSDAASVKSARRVHPIVSKSHGPRIFLYASFCLLIASIKLPEQVALVVVASIASLVYPHAAHFFASRSSDPLKAAMRVLQADALTVGLNVAVLSFSLLPSLAIVTILTGTLLLMGGLRVARFIWLVPAGAVLGLTFSDFRPYAAVGVLGELTVYLMVIFYILSIAYFSNATTRDAISAKQELGKKNKQVLEQAEALAAINEITHAVNASLRPDDVAQAVMSGLQKIFSFDIMSVALIDEDRKELILDRELGSGDLDLSKFEGLFISLGDKGSGFAHAIRTRKPVYLPSFSESDLQVMCAADRAVYDAAPSKSLLIVPLIVQGKALGTISFSSSNDEFQLEPRDIQRIEKYVSQLATAIRNARLFEEAKMAKAEALAANETKSQFLANMSHELRTPMNAVIGYSEMLEEEAEEEGLTGYIPDLQKIQSAGRHLLELINGILDLSKIEANKMELYLEDCDVGQLVDGVASTVKPLVAKNDNTLEVERDPELGSMHADVTKIRQSLLNLLSNASKFTEKGTLRLTVRREAAAAGDWLTFAVSDTGIGMSEEQLDKLFQPFTQADASTTRKYGGTGLGLTISKRFCEMMGGDILAKSVPGQGSTFTIKVPAVVAESTVGEHQ